MTTEYAETEINQQSTRRKVGFATLFGSLFLMLALSSPRAVWAQLSTARVSGTVHDQQGAVIPGAEIIATQTDTGYVARTSANASGQFNLPTLPVGPYILSIQVQGFQKYEQRGLVLAVGQELAVDASLTVGASDQTVNVEADAVSIDATSPTQQSTVEEKVIRVKGGLKVVSLADDMSGGISK